MKQDTLLVGFVGGPCTGKTTLANFVSEELRQRGFRVGTSREFVTEDVKRNGPPSADNLAFEHIRFYMNQCLEEQRACEGRQVVVTDCPTFLTYIYAEYGFGNSECPRDQLALADLREAFMRDVRRYKCLYLLRREFPYEDNGVRFHTLNQAMAVDSLIERLLNEAGADYAWLEGTVAERAARVVGDVHGSLKPRAVAAA